MWGATKLRGLNRAGCAGVPAKLLIVSLSVFLFAVHLLAGQTPDTMGQIQGTVFVQDSQGQSCIPNAKVILQASVVMETKTDESGKFEFRGVPPGTYIIKAEAPGLVATQEVTIEVAKVAQFSLELRPTTVQDSVTVTAAASDSPATFPSPSGTVTASTLQNAPNIDDRAESILPTLPGVVRGPDGRINMKGARSTQSGALVNSVNATDPATGNPGIAVPIDVVASVQVISNPYDPQYGKLTGAVSTLDTKTGNFEKWHCSINNFIPRVRLRDDTVFGIGAATPRTTCTGPLWRDHIAFTQSLEYRFVRTPVNSLPPFQRDRELQFLHAAGFQPNSETDWNLFCRGLSAEAAIPRIKHIYPTAVHVGLPPARISALRTASVPDRKRKPADFTVQLQDIRRGYHSSRLRSLSALTGDDRRRILQFSDAPSFTFRLGRSVSICAEAFSWNSRMARRVGIHTLQLQRSPIVYPCRDPRV
jgi:hypothetical protein